MKPRIVTILFLTGLMAAAWAQQGGLVNGLRGEAPLAAEPAALPMPKMINDDQRRARAYPMQPPVIPHQVENYQVDRQFNKCMNCHGRDRVQDADGIDGERGVRHPVDGMRWPIGEDEEHAGDHEERRERGQRAQQPAPHAGQPFDVEHRGQANAPSDRRRGGASARCYRARTVAPSPDADLAADLVLALSLADAADALTVPRFRARDLQVSTKPDATPVTIWDPRQAAPASADVAPLDAHR